MFVLGSIVALGAALVFAAVAGILAWGGIVSLRRELLRGFVSTNPSPAERALAIALVAIPLLGAALLSLLAAGQIALVALGLN